MAVLEEPEVHLQHLEVEFMVALELRTKGKSDEARQKLENVLRVDPRLPEPRLEMARIYLETQRLEDAETEVREALSLLQAGGQWVETVPENVMLSLAWALLGEILKQQATTDEVVFGDPEVFRTLIRESQAAFAKAHELDPDDTASLLNSKEMEDPEDPEDPEEPEDDA